MKLCARFTDWLGKCLDMHLSFDGDPVLRPERKPVRNVGAYYTSKPVVAAIESGGFLATIAKGGTATVKA